MYNKLNDLTIYTEDGLSKQYNFSKTCQELVTNGNVIQTYNRLYIYKNIIFRNTVEIKMNKDEYEKFRFRPKLLSQLLYNTTELWYLILYVNDMIDITEFDKEIIRVFHPDKLDLLNSIFIKENMMI